MRLNTWQFLALFWLLLALNLPSGYWPFAVALASLAAITDLWLHARKRPAAQSDPTE